MRLNERQHQILTIINQEQFISVNDLCERLFASPATIRRDLHVLEASHSIQRVFGGAVPIIGNAQDSPIANRQRRNNKEKMTIARIARQFVHNGATILLDASTTTCYVAQQLEAFENLTVLTNSLDNIAVLTNMPRVTTIVTGGIISNGSQLRGALTRYSIEQYNADLCFMSCGTVSAENGVTYTNEDSANVRRLMAKHAKKKILLCDSSKFDRSYFFRALSIEDFDHIVCDIAPQNKALRDLMGERLICADGSHEI